eukprot:6297976-Amphidinium_carterae.2
MELAHQCCARVAFLMPALFGLECGELPHFATRCLSHLLGQCARLHAATNSTFPYFHSKSLLLGL